MGRLMILGLMIVVSTSCQPGGSTDKKTANVTIDTFSSLPEDDWGAGCYYFLNRKQYHDGIILFGQGISNNAYMRISGVVTRFTPDSTGRLYNDRYEVIVDTQETGSIDYTRMYKGKIKLKDKKGRVVAERNIVGECGC